MVTKMIINKGALGTPHAVIVEWFFCENNRFSIKKIKE